MGKNSLLVKMILFFVILLVLPITLAGFYLFSEINKDLTQMEKERVKISNQATANLIQQMGIDLLGLANGNSHWEDYHVAVEQKNVNWIVDNINSDLGPAKGISFIATADLKGNVLSQAGDVKEFSGTLAEKEIISKMTQNNKLSGLVNTSKGLAVFAASYITNADGSEQPSGILIYGRLLDEKALAEIKETLHDDIAILSKDGSMLSTTKLIKQEQLTKYQNNLDQQRDLEDFQTNSEKSTEYAEYTTSLKSFSGEPLAILHINEKQAESTKVKAELINVNLIIAAIMLVILILLSFVIYRFMIKPVKSIVSISGEVSKGVLSCEVDHKISKRSDEIGKLGNAMNIMIENFRNLIKEVAQAIEQVASSAEQLSASSEETTKATNQIAAAIQEVAGGSDVQLQGTLDSSSAVKQMAVGIQNIADTVSHISVNSTETEKEVVSGNQSIQKAIQQMQNISVSFNESSLIVNQLTDRSQEIGQIALLISNIADQTNLLALNAAIEAARAGEHGRGFAVVADEVRKLAEQSAVSAKQVSELVSVIQRDSASSVQSMNKVNSEVHEGLNQIENVGEVFENILSATKDVTRLTQELASITPQMEASTEKVASSITEVAEIAKGSANSSRNVAYSSNEQLSAMKEIAASSGYLDKMAQDLKGLIHKFKL
ncbi:methyl-accepting chemotaxis protein [Neobacillus sp. LXY-1]|uniref:methyl-accepting chemotaxis protein n=1 Tax=Neobacillus sp. LXY-1 TaxID=3379133 RepID=UPI003EDF5851